MQQARLYSAVGSVTDQGIKSRPRYVPLALAAEARSSLLVCDDKELPASAFANPASVDRYDEVWTIAGNSRAIPSPEPGSRAHAFRSASHLMIALRHHLSRQRMGFRLHAVGTEPFLWSVAGAAEEAGLDRAEYQLFPHGSQARRVFCVHCRTITPAVTTTLVTCGGCRAKLFVRDHFSRRLNAFMGVQVDAEVPGERPEVEEAYS